ncbi:type II secretion system protein N [Kordiimonas sp.]|uniref:type II secretion system protein N n=1 Tax=Kordiimonas sp. TaxID=1970157 RepID=UPI003A8CF77C
MLSRAQLLALFVVAFVVFFVAFMPARLAVGWMGLSDTIRYSGVAGSMTEARLTAVSYRGVPIGDITIEPSVPALLMGSFRGDVTLRGGETYGDFEVSEYSVSEIIIEKGSLNMPFAAALKGWPLSGAVSLTTDGLTLNTSQGCADGSFALRTDAFAQALRVFGGDDVILAGDGRCAAGRLNADLSGENAVVSVTVAAAWERGASLRADIVLTPKAGATVSEATQMMLDFAGLRREGKVWRGRLSVPVGF